MIGSDNPEKYCDGRQYRRVKYLKIFIIFFFQFLIEVSKHFGGLRVIDFPVYVQGLELKEASGSEKSSHQKGESTISMETFRI
jgi:hypothetical protein